MLWANEKETGFKTDMKNKAIREYTRNDEGIMGFVIFDF
jgi:hypothetical protein